MFSGQVDYYVSHPMDEIGLNKIGVHQFYVRFMFWVRIWGIYHMILSTLIYFLESIM